MRTAVIDWLKIGAVAGIVVGALAAASAAASSGDAAEAAAASPYGAYLAGRHAQERGSYGAAALWYEQALRTDPQSPELISRTFLMEADDGHFDRAVPLAKQALRLDGSDAIANLVLLIDRAKAGDNAGALARAEALPDDGLHRYVGPLARAWTRMGMGNLAGAEAALQDLDKFDGFAPLEYFQLGMIYDFAGNSAKAEEYYKKTLDATGQLNWRLADTMANFYLRHGRPDAAKAIDDRFVKENAGSELAESVQASTPKGTPAPLIGSAMDGLAEALFDLASVVNRPETVDLALVYDRCALELRPNLTVAQLLLADILSDQEKYQQSLAVVTQIPANSRYSWSAQLRAAANLEALGRIDQATAQLQAMAAKEPNWASAEIQLADLLRGQKRFSEAADAYSEAIKRLKAEGMPPRWALYYSRGIAYERSNQWSLAEADLEHALELKPDQPLVLNYLGYSWIDRGEKLHPGLKMIEKAVELSPDDGYIVDSLGWAHYRLGDYPSAVEYLEKALELVPEDPTINDHLGDAYWKSGRTTEARYQWRRALQFKPEKEDVKPIEAKLDGGLPKTTRAGGG
ncbi:MAG TPA: tetratricopeptide repeat protein [Stellaceae bacterium]|jgi:tetratricopeptide (TPR) repeat protein|nr:tetratricopeptide repeat protein [Stellaceae bacterium]